MTFSVTWPMRIKNSLNGGREHWAVRARRAKAERNATRLMLSSHRAADHIIALEMAGGLASPKRIAVRLTRVYAGRARKMDDDGCTAAFKNIRDGVAAYFELDDADPRIRFETAQVRGEQNAVRIDFAVEDDARARAELAAADTHARIAGILEAHRDD